MLGFYDGMDLSEFYNVLAVNLFYLIIVLIVLFILVKWKVVSKFFGICSKVFRKENKITSIAILVLIVATIVVLGYLIGVINDLDRSTTTKIEDKILIIEIDDYWNIDETGRYFEPYGYTLEQFREVSDVLDKHGYTASLGLTPFIFVEERGENYALEDDERMVEYLHELDSRGYELAMHGYNHCRNAVYCPKYEEVWHNVYVGKEHLERLFGKPFVTYFPPGNYWTDEQYDNVKRAGFLTIGNTHVPKVYFDEEVIITPRSFDPIWHYAWYQKDFRHMPANEWIEEFNKTNFFVLQLHCNTFDSEEKLEDLDKFLKYVSETNTKVMTYREFYDYAVELRDSDEDLISKSPIFDGLKA